MPSDRFSARYEELLDVAEALEQSVMEMIEHRRSEPIERNDVLSLLVRGHNEEGRLTDEELVGQACVLFAAAHMTTSHALTWTLLLLALHPEIYDRVYREAMADPAEKPELSRAIKESMRILPASAYSQRMTNQAVELGPFQLARGTPVVFTPLVTHRLESLYDEPKRFHPDRWKTLQRTGYEYLPFGGGNRLCIGGPLAMEILRTAIPRFLRNFRMAVPAGTPIEARVQSTMLMPVSRVEVELHAPDSQPTSGPIAGNVAELVDIPTSTTR